MATRPVHVVVPIRDHNRTAMSRFRQPPRTWLPPPATPTPDGHVVHLVTGSLLPVTHVPVEVRVGPSIDASGAMVIRSLSWRAVRLAPAFPVLDADLELDCRGEPTLRLLGRYVPPLAVVGDVADRLLGRHLVTEVARSFVTDVAGRLSSTGGTWPQASPVAGGEA